MSFLFFPFSFTCVVGKTNCVVGKTNCAVGKTNCMSGGIDLRLFVRLFREREAILELH